MTLQDNIDQKVTDDVQSHMGRLTYNNIVLSAQVEALQAELSRVYDQANDLTTKINELTARAERAEAREPEPGESGADVTYVEGEVVGNGEATSG